MSSVQIVKHFINHIVKEGKDRLHDTYINKEKVPSYTNIKSNSDYQQIILHGGFKAQQNKKFGYFRLKRDQLPVRSGIDTFAVKATKIIINHNTQKLITKQSPKSTSKKFSKYRKNNNKSNLSIKSVGFNTMKSGHQTQTNLIKLQQNSKISEVGMRVKQKHEQFDQFLRAQKQEMIINRNKQMEQNKFFQQQRVMRSAQKKKIVQQHINKGQNYKINFDNDGEIILFQSSEKKTTKMYPRETPYKIEGFQNQQNEKPQGNVQKYQRYKSNHYHANKNINNYDNQRIKSARGLAFASSVLRTMNLSKISINNSYQQFQPEQFMKRNDLFNNNHSRQTTNIPYFQPKSGTVYTEIATNQVVGTKPSSTTKTNQIFQSQNSGHEKTLTKISKKFESFLKNGDRINCKTSRQQQDYIKNSQRVIKTADNSGRKQYFTQKRPHSSNNNKGRIITANSNLIVNLLQ